MVLALLPKGAATGVKVRTAGKETEGSVEPGGSDESGGSVKLGESVDPGESGALEGCVEPGTEGFVDIGELDGAAGELTGALVGDPQLPAICHTIQTFKFH